MISPALGGGHDPRNIPALAPVASSVTIRAVIAVLLLALPANAAIHAPLTPVGRTSCATPRVEIQPPAVIARPTAPKKRRRSLTEVLRLLEDLRSASKDMWFTTVKIDMDGRVKLSVLVRAQSNRRSCFGLTRHLEPIKKYEKEFRSVRLNRITWQPCGLLPFPERVVAAADLEIVLNKP